MSEKKLITFEPLDSVFFREAKPFNAGEGGFLDSQFPPPAQTLSGAIRSAIGEASGIDWKAKADVVRLLGTADAPVHSFAGPYLLKDGLRLYPVPLNLLLSEGEDANTHEKKKDWVRLTPSYTTFKTDMGARRLPKSEKSAEGAKPVEEGWLDAANMGKVLNGDLPDTYISADNVLVRESRAGIGRDNLKSVINKGMLYFTRHLRLREGFTLGMTVDGVTSLANCMMRFGGEGRLSRMTVGSAPAALSAPIAYKQAKGLILMLLTHGDFGGKGESGLSNDSALKNVHKALTLVTACIGKPVREGGWDYAKREPKPLKSLVPAGSCYFVEVIGDSPENVIAQLHGKHIGQRTAFGYGEIAVGIWK